MLLIDIGNSITTLALSGHGGRGISGKTLKLPTHTMTARSAAAALDRLSAERRLDGAVGASVVPGVNPRWSRAIQRAAGIRLHWIRHDWSWNFAWRYPHPETLGADRIVNLCAARRRHPPPLVVLDFGTALTVDMLNEKNEFIGGMIAPGFTMMTDAMAQRTALLPEMTLRIGRIPTRACGRNTREAMRHGMLFGYRGMVRELIASATAPFGNHATVCATGGYAAAVMAALPEIRCRVHPALTMEGLAFAARLIMESAPRRDTP